MSWRANFLLLMIFVVVIIPVPASAAQLNGFYIVETSPIEKKSNPLTMTALTEQDKKFFAGIAAGQGLLPPGQTALEAFEQESASDLVKEFYAIGQTYGSYDTLLKISAAVFYKASEEAQPVKGLRIEIIKALDLVEFKKALGALNFKQHLDASRRYQGALGDSLPPSISVSFLDMDEIEDLLKAIDYMARLAERWLGKPEYIQSTFVYRTRSDFQIGFLRSDTIYTSPKSKCADSETKECIEFAWVAFDAKPVISITLARLDQLKKIIKNGLEYLSKGQCYGACN